MPIQYVDSDDFDAVVNIRVDLYDDGAGYVVGVFDRACEIASSIALSAMRQAGYNPAEDSLDDMVKATALAVLVYLAYGRKQRTVPESTALIFAALPEAIRTGALPLIDEAIANVTEAVGGVAFTSQDDTTTAGGATIRVRRSPVMRDLGNDL